MKKIILLFGLLMIGCSTIGFGEFEDINNAEAFIDSNWFGEEKKFYTIEEKS